ncbi:MAG TPA: hypothetical protein VLV86_22040, partial [Vicinamibacterales bacterium]|nr:hypothetical protein [Vicinamibacterales bacterium]
MRAWSLFLCCTSLVAGAAGASAQEAGISQTLARDRALRISNVRYELAFSIPRDKTSTISGRETVTFVLDDASRPLLLDFAAESTRRVHSLNVGAESLAPRLVNGHLELPASALRAGENRVGIDFDAGDAPLNRNDEFLYTIFVPARAHEAFPCFDQPDVKARWTLALDVPEGWAALGNGAEASTSSAGGRTRVTFAETPPISTYLFAFATGKFSVERAERNGRVMRMF